MDSWINFNDDMHHVTTLFNIYRNRMDGNYANLVDAAEHAEEGFIITLPFMFSYYTNPKNNN